MVLAATDRSIAAMKRSVSEARSPWLPWSRGLREPIPLEQDAPLDAGMSTRTVSSSSVPPMIYDEVVTSQGLDVL